MAKWINRTVIQAPRNGTTSHTVSFTAATAGNLLVMVMEGAVTHTIPTGWTRQNQALNFTELSVYTKTATAGESSFSTTHNGSNYPVGVVVYEFVSGTTWVNSVSSAGAGSGDANASLTGLTGTNLLFGFIGVAAPSGATTTTWNSPNVEDVDVCEVNAGTDGYLFSGSYQEDSTATSHAPTSSGIAGIPKETLTFAVNVAGLANPVISLRTAGTPTSTTALVTAINPAVPTGTTTGDISVLTVTMKPYTATITTPSGWTKIGETTSGTTANALDAGSTKVAVYVRESAPVGAIGNLTLAGTPNTVGAVINSYQKTNGGYGRSTWNYANYTTGNDTTATGWSATGAANISIGPGDWVIASSGTNTDAGLVTSPSIAAAGATMAAATKRTESDVTTGNDSALVVVDAACTAGTSTAAPVLTFTNSSLTTTVRGCTLFLRLDAVGVPSRSATLTGSGTLTTSGKPKHKQTRTLTGSGTLTTAGKPDLAQTRTLTGSGLLTTSGKPDIAQTASMSGSGTLTVTGVVSSGITLTPGTAAESTTSVTTLSVPLPSGLAAGDYVLLVGTSNASGGGFTTDPAGYTVIYELDTVNGSTSGHGAAYYRKWVSGDTDPTLTFSSGRAGGRAFKVSGANGSTFIDGTYQVTQAASTVTAVDAPTVTPSTNIARKLVTVHTARSATGNVFITWTPPSGMVEAGEAGGKDTTTTNSSFSVSSLDVTGTGATGAKTATASATTTGAFGVSLLINPAGGTTAFTGSAALGGTGTLTVAGVPKPKPTVNTSGTGTLTVAGKPRGIQTRTLTGSGALTLTPKPKAVQPVTLTGTGTLTNAGKPKPKQTVNTSGSGTLTTPAQAPKPKVTVARTGSGTLTTPAQTPRPKPTVALAGSGLLAVTPKPDLPQTRTLSGAGTLTVTGKARPAVTVGGTGAGTLAVTPKPKAKQTTALSGSGTLVISSGGRPVLSGSGTLTVSGTPKPKVVTALTGSGALTAPGKPHVPGSTTLTGSGLLAPAGRPKHKQPAALSGAGVLTTAGKPKAKQTTNLTGSGALTIEYSGKANIPLSGAGTLTVTGKARPKGTVALSGAGTQTTTRIVHIPGTVVPRTGSGTLTTGGKPKPKVTVDRTGDGTVTVAGKAHERATAPLGGTGTLTITGTPRFKATRAGTGSGTLGVTGTPKPATSRALTGGGTLTLTSHFSGVTHLDLIGGGTLGVVGRPHLRGAVGLSGQGTTTDSPSPHLPRTVALTGSGLLGLTYHAVYGNQADLHGTGTLTVSGVAAVLLRDAVIGARVAPLPITATLSHTGVTVGLQERIIALSLHQTVTAAQGARLIEAKVHHHEH